MAKRLLVYGPGLLSLACGALFTRLWRAALLGQPAPPLEAAAWKVLAGTVFGLLFGAARYKSGRICPSLLLHMAVNTFGS